MTPPVPPSGGADTETPTETGPRDRLALARVIEARWEADGVTRAVRDYALAAADAALSVPAPVSDGAADVLRMLADPEHYKRVYAEDGVPCPVEGCRISAQEHHRLAFGWLNQLRDLRTPSEVGA